MSRSCPDSKDARTGMTSLELALRAARSGQKTCLIQLQAGREPYEELVVEDDLLPYLNVFPALDAENIVFEKNIMTGCFLREAIELARLALACGKYDLVILDEVISALSSGSIKVEDIQELKNSPHSTELVLIGMSEDNDFALPGHGSSGVSETLKQQNRALRTLALQGRGYETTRLH